MRSVMTGDSRILELLGNINRTYCAILDEKNTFVYCNRALLKLLEAYDLENIEGKSLKELFSYFKEWAFVEEWQSALSQVTEETASIHFNYNLEINGRSARVEAEIQGVFEQGKCQFLVLGMDEVTDIYLKHRFESLKSNFLVRAIQVSDEEELMWVLIDELLSKLYFEDALILKKKGDVLRPVAAYGNQRKGKRVVKSAIEVSIKEGITGYVARSGESHLSGDCPNDPYYINRHFAAQSEVAVPVMVRGQVYGVINCESLKPNFFRAVHRELLLKAAEVLQLRIEEMNSKADLMRLEQRHLAIINSTPNSFLLFDTSFKLMSFNNAATKSWRFFTDVELEEGLSHLKAIPPSLIEVFLSFGQQSLEGKHNQEFLSWHRQNELFRLKLSFAPAHNPDGQIFGFTMLIEDVTELYIANENLREKNKNLEQSNRELDQFVYSISHDLRAPLSSIMGLVNLIEGAQHLAETKIYGKMLADATESMDSYIRNILEYSRNKRFDTEMVQVDLVQVLDEVTDKFRFIPGYRELDFQLDLRVKKLIGDPYRLEIILNNLISNAIKYRDLAKKESWCKVFIGERETEWEIQVSDNGIGIPEDKQSKLFDMFFKVKSEHPGSGLGLYILKEVVDNLNGSIEVHSQVTKGTTFTVLLPKEVLNG